MIVLAVDAQGVYIIQNVYQCTRATGRNVLQTWFNVYIVNFDLPTVFFAYIVINLPWNKTF